MNEIEHILNRLQLGNGIEINKLHWIDFADFIIRNPIEPKQKMICKLSSVLCVQRSRVIEYINCALAWEVLICKNDILNYNRTYKEG
jgi:hypothetical protein